jgi:hypothetical protein
MYRSSGWFHSNQAKLFPGLPQMISSLPKDWTALGFGTEQNQMKSKIKEQQKATALVLAPP